ncbi:putative glutathione synthase [Helianthus annuus]|nr:putative glutathione synthase [Helianthus annuus]
MNSPPPPKCSSITTNSSTNSHKNPISDPHSIDLELVQKLVNDALVWSSFHGLVVGDRNVEIEGVDVDGDVGDGGVSGDGGSGDGGDSGWSATGERGRWWWSAAGEGGRWWRQVMASSLPNFGPSKS